MKYQPGIDYPLRLGREVVETDESYVYQLGLHLHQPDRVLWRNKGRQTIYSDSLCQ